MFATSLIIGNNEYGDAVKIYITPTAPRLYRCGGLLRRCAGDSCEQRVYLRRDAGLD
jgi:hypothetical protein